MITVLTHFADACNTGGGFFGFPTWYKYLPQTVDSTGKCLPKISSISDFWLIVAAVIDILLRLAALAAIVFIVYGGIQFITSHGEPEHTAKARNTIINAIIGLVISVAAAALVTFLAGRF